MRLGSGSVSDKDKDIGILKTILSPVLNPVIYSFWNPDMLGTLKRVLTGKCPPTPSEKAGASRYPSLFEHPHFLVLKAWMWAGEYSRVD